MCSSCPIRVVYAFYVEETASGLSGKDFQVAKYKQIIKYTHACTKVHLHSQLFCVFSVVDEYKTHVTPSLKNAIPWQSFTYAHGAHSARIFKRMLFCH